MPIINAIDEEKGLEHTISFSHLEVGREGFIRRRYGTELIDIHKEKLKDYSAFFEPIHNYLMMNGEIIFQFHRNRKSPRHGIRYVQGKIYHLNSGITAFEQEELFELDNSRFAQFSLELIGSDKQSSEIESIAKELQLQRLYGYGVSVLNIPGDFVSRVFVVPDEYPYVGFKY